MSDGRAAAELARDHSGQSQWALVWHQFSQRKLAVAAAYLILLLTTVSIFAPLIANDRPYFYHGINRADFLENGRNLRGLLKRAIDLSKAESGPLPAAVSAGSRTLMNQLVASLAANDAAPATELSQQLTAALGADSLDRAVKLGEVERGVRALVLKPGITPVAQTGWPIFQSLSAIEVLFMLANVGALALVACGWIRTVLGRRRSQWLAWASSKTAVVGVLLVLPIAGATGWSAWNPTRLDKSNYKQAVLANDPDAATAGVVFNSVAWPPVTFAIDESNLGNKFARPAWYSPSAEEKSRPPLVAQSRWDTPHWLGTDQLGRDSLARLIWGGRVSLSVGVVAVSIYVTIGIVIGSIAGYFRGWVDLFISRLIEVVICFPQLFLILAIVAFVGPNIINIMLVIGVTGWTGVARLIRAEFLRLVGQEFVLAGRALGYSPFRLIFRHVLPNAMAPVLVSATFGVAGAILTESSLSFLGLGISVPTPSWGALLNDGRAALTFAPWLIHFPGLVIFLTITSYNLVGEALRDASDPRLRGAQ